MLQATRSPLRPSPVGTLLKEWREDRRRSQLDLALDVGVSTRHLSFVETGKARPSPELVLALAEHLDVPLRERNTLLLAAGYAPRYQHTPLDSEAMASVRAALGQLIRAHDPYPATVVDRHWNLVMANEGALTLVSGIAAHLLAAPLNTYRADAAPRRHGAADREPRRMGPPPVGHPRPPSRRYSRPRAASAAQRSRRLPQHRRARHDVARSARTCPRWSLRCGSASRGDAVQSWFSTNTSIGTPADITLDELHIELFHPADAATAAAVGR